MLLGQQPVIPAHPSCCLHIIAIKHYFPFDLMHIKWWLLSQIVLACSFFLKERLLTLCVYTYACAHVCLKVHMNHSTCLEAREQLLRISFFLSTLWVELRSSGFVCHKDLYLLSHPTSLRTFFLISYLLCKLINIWNTLICTVKVWDTLDRKEVWELTLNLMASVYFYFIYEGALLLCMSEPCACLVSMKGRRKH